MSMTCTESRRPVPFPSTHKFRCYVSHPGLVASLGERPARHLFTLSGCRVSLDLSPSFWAAYLTEPPICDAFVPLCNGQWKRPVEIFWQHTWYLTYQCRGIDQSTAWFEQLAFPIFSETALLETCPGDRYTRRPASIRQEPNAVPNASSKGGIYSNAR